MNTRICISLFIFFIGTWGSLAQDIKVKKDDILLDNKPFIKYEKITIVEYSIKDLSGSEILFFQTKQDQLTGASYLSFNFVGLKKKIESNNIGRISSLGYKNMLEKLITWLVKDHVLNADGSINPEQLDVFSDKYNDHK